MDHVSPDLTVARPKLLTLLGYVSTFNCNSFRLYRKRLTSSSWRELSLKAESLVFSELATAAVPAPVPLTAHLRRPGLWGIHGPENPKFIFVRQGVPQPAAKVQLQSPRWRVPVLNRSNSHHHCADGAEESTRQTEQLPRKARSSLAHPQICTSDLKLEAGYDQHS